MTRLAARSAEDRKLMEKLDEAVHYHAKDAVAAVRAESLSMKEQMERLAEQNATAVDLIKFMEENGAKVWDSVTPSRLRSVIRSHLMNTSSVTLPEFSCTSQCRLPRQATARSRCLLMNIFFVDPAASIVGIGSSCQADVSPSTRWTRKATGATRSRKSRWCPDTAAGWSESEAWRRWKRPVTGCAYPPMIWPVAETVVHALVTGFHKSRRGGAAGSSDFKWTQMTPSQEAMASVDTTLLAAIPESGSELGDSPLSSLLRLSLYQRHGTKANSTELAWRYRMGARA